MRKRLKFEPFFVDIKREKSKIGNVFFKKKNSYILDTQIKINSILIGYISLENLKENLNKCMEDVINGQTENAQ